MKILVVGLGSIGRRHIKNLKAVDPALELAILREHSKSADLGDVSGLIGQVFFEQEKAIAWHPQAVVIANPASAHMATALCFAQAGAHLFIEKPLSMSLEGIDGLQKICQDKKLIAVVGYVMRFLSPIVVMKEALMQGKIGRLLSVQAKVGKYLPSWRTGDYRTQVSARRDLGGGVVLELSHEIDYVRWLAGEIKEIQAMTGKLSDLDIDVEDVAEIQACHEGGVLSHIHLDMVDHAPNRGCRLIGTEGTLVWDNMQAEHIVRLWRSTDKEWQTIYEQKNLDANVMHAAQWRHFFDCINTGCPPLVSLKEAKRVLELSLSVLGSPPLVGGVRGGGTAL